MGAGPTTEEGVVYRLPLGRLGLRPARERRSAQADARRSSSEAAGRTEPEVGPSRLAARRRLSPDGLGAHVDRLYRAAWAMSGNREDAQDLVQETFARVLAKPRFVRAGTDEAYLLRALRNTYFDSRRTAARRPSTEELPDEHRLVDSRPGDPAEVVVNNDLLFAAIAALSDDYRDALVAVDIVGLSYGEAAKALKAREKTIATRLFRARQQVARGITDASSNGAAAKRSALPGDSPLELVNNSAKDKRPDHVQA